MALADGAISSREWSVLKRLGEQMGVTRTRVIAAHGGRVYAPDAEGRSRASFDPSNALVHGMAAQHL